MARARYKGKTYSGISPMVATFDFTSTWKGAAAYQMTMQQGKQALNQVVQYLAEQAKIRAPYDTGLLKDSIRTWDAEQRGTTIVASYGVPRYYEGTDMLYGYWQEVGFFHHGSGEKIQNAYLLPAIEQNFEGARTVFRQGWDFSGL